MALRILLCDDNRDFVSTLALLLQSEGHETWQCLLGRAAIDKARQWQPPACKKRSAVISWISSLQLRLNRTLPK